MRANRKHNRAGAFTLVEILIVVVILGILAAIVVPQFTSAADEARGGNVQTQISTLETQLELWAARNNGAYPDPRYGGATIQNVDFDGTASLIFDEIGGPVVAPGSDVLASGGSLEVAGPNSLWRINVAAFSGKVTVEQLDVP